MAECTYVTQPFLVELTSDILILQNPATLANLNADRSLFVKLVASVFQV